MSDSITISFPGRAPAATPAPPATVVIRDRLWSRVRIVIAAVCLGIVLLASARLSFVRGTLRTIRIEGGSMAESLCGDHLRTRCQDCEYVVRCDVASVPADGALLCPNCGFAGNSEDDAQVRSGERVLVDAFPVSLGRLRRWDLVAINQFTNGSGPVAKRLVAFPGERWAVRDGDLWINGQIQRKTLSQLREMMVVINDDRYRPASQQGQSRWRPSGDSGWQADRRTFRYVRSPAASATADWLVYHHQRGLGATPGAELATTIKDLDAYNQAESRTLFAVNDVGASLRLEAQGADTLEFAVTGHAGRLICSLRQRAGRIVLHREGETLVDEPLTWHDWRRPTLVEFGVCDQQFLLGMDGREVLRKPLLDEPFLPSSDPLGLRVVAESAALSQLRVWRDLHYLGPHGRSATWQPSRALAADEVAILGDNPPVSIDTRHTAAPVPREHVWGHVKRPFASP